MSRRSRTGVSVLCTVFVLPWMVLAVVDRSASGPSLPPGRCWGYEQGCRETNRISRPACEGDSRGWAKSRKEQVQSFFDQADFGYVAREKATLKMYCSSGTYRAEERPNGSWLECTDHLHFCRGNMLSMDLRPLSKRKDNLLYKMDVLESGALSGNCVLNETLLRQNLDEMSPLQSWAPEMKNFVGDGANGHKTESCDLTFDRPVYVMKLDAEVNFYHHFCDFFNLFASLHLNNDGKLMPSPWTDDVQVILWQSIAYRSNFKPAWRPFTKHPVLTLSELAGRRVCFRGGVVFPLLPRMIFGLYYNTPVVPGCRSSGLFQAFNRFMTNSLVPNSVRCPKKNGASPVNPPFPGPEPPVRVTLLSRLTSHRRILNEDHLLAALRSIPRVAAVRAEFTFRTPFLEQLELIQATDVLIGMHGSGLTHSLFLPDWAAVFELFNCGDADCYFDLARLRGIAYYTWPSSSSEGSTLPSGITQLVPEEPAGRKRQAGHEKFANYMFEVAIFKKVVSEIVANVLNHPSFPSLSSSDAKSACDDDGSDARQQTRGTEPDDAASDSVRLYEVSPSLVGSGSGEL